MMETLNDIKSVKKSVVKYYAGKLRITTKRQNIWSGLMTQQMKSGE